MSRDPRLTTYLESEVQHAFALDDQVGILWDLLATDRAGVAFPRRKDRRDDLRRYLVHQACCEDLTRISLRRLLRPPGSAGE